MEIGKDYNMAGNLNNGYIRPIPGNVTRAKVIFGGKKMSPKSVVAKRESAPKNHTPMTKNPVSHSRFLPKQVNSVSKNVGSAPARGFGR